MPIMKIEYQTPQTVGEIAAVFSSLTPMRDTSQKHRLAFWVDRLADVPLADFSPDDVDRLLAELETAPGASGKLRSGPTINRYRMAMQSLIKFARQKRLLPRGWVSPFDHVPQHKENPGKLRFLTSEEEARLMAAARLQSWPLLPLLIRTAIVTGLRRGALLGIRWCDVRLDTDQPHVVIPRTKNGDTHVSPLTADLALEFRRMQRVKATGDALVFVGKHLHIAHDFRHAFSQACKEAGLEDVSFHTLRHTSCSRLAQAGVDLLAIAEHAGHRSLSMTRRYSHLSIKGRASMVSSVFA